MTEYNCLYFHSPNTPSWRGAQLKKAQGQIYLLPLQFTAKFCVLDLQSTYFWLWPSGLIRVRTRSYVRTGIS